MGGNMSDVVVMYVMGGRPRRSGSSFRRAITYKRDFDA